MGRAGHSCSPKHIQATDNATLQELTAGNSTGCCSVTCQQAQTLPVLPTRYFHCCHTLYWFGWYFFSNLQMQSGTVSWHSFPCRCLDLGSSWSSAAARGQGWAWELPREELSSSSSSSKGLTQLERWLWLDSLLLPKVCHLSTSLIKGS